MYVPDDITLYIPCHNAEKTLAQVIEAIKQQTIRPKSILLIDDGSHSPIPSFPGIKTVQHDTNQGLATARNTALEHCLTPLLAALDSDVAPDPDWLEKLLDALNSGNFAGVGGRMDERFADTLPNRWRAHHMAQHWGSTCIENPRFLYGANTLFRTEALRKAGGYDRRHRTNDEDRAISETLYTLGHKLLYFPEAHCEHLRQDTLQSILPGYWRWHYTRGLLQGDFDQPELLVTPRMEAVNFGIFRYRFDSDRAAERVDFMAVDLCIPWVFCAQDLLFFARRHECAVPAFPETELLDALDSSVAAFILNQIPAELSEYAGRVNWAQPFHFEFCRLLDEYGWYSEAYSRVDIIEYIRGIQM
jgi:glycosyltransferase involved in cell wall biosynthesis